MYVKKVRLVQRPPFMMVIKSHPLSFIAMAPPARREWDPTADALIPMRWSCRAVTAPRTAIRTFAAVIWRPSGRREMGDSEEAPRQLRTVVTRRASAATGHAAWPGIAWWWMVSPLVPFFWLSIRRATPVAVNSVCRLAE